jgi:hypothetical protein
MEGLTSQQRTTVLKLMASGFKNYAEKYGDRRHVGPLTDSEGENRLLILSCGAEFGAILARRSDWPAELPDLPVLREDLFHLIEGGCPVLDIIDLMFACTQGRTPAIPDRLESIGLQGPSLQLLRQLCLLVSEKISALNRSGAGPLSFLSELLPELPADEQRGRLEEDLQRLPDLLGLFGDLLSIYPPSEIVSTHANAFFRNCELVLFYMLVDRFNFGFPTLSRLLRAMRHARSLASPKASYLRRIAPNSVSLSERSKSEQRSDVRDPLGEKALQKRLNLFFRDNHEWQFVMRVWVMRYLSDEFSQHRASGAIFFSVWNQLREPVR